MADKINWNGLLAWSAKHHDGTKAAKEFKPLSGEDKDFLEKALIEAFGHIEDANEIMQDALQKNRQRRRRHRRHPNGARSRRQVLRLPRCP